LITYKEHNEIHPIIGDKVITNNDLIFTHTHSDFIDDHEKEVIAITDDDGVVVYSDDKIIRLANTNSLKKVDIFQTEGRNYKIGNYAFDDNKNLGIIKGIYISLSKAWDNSSTKNMRLKRKTRILIKIENGECSFNNPESVSLIINENFKPDSFKTLTSKNTYYESINEPKIDK